MQSFADALRERAEQLGLSNAEVARRSGLTERRYGNYVSGIREPDLATLVSIARALQSTPSLLLGFEAAEVRSSTAILLEQLRAVAAGLEAADIETVII